MTTDRDATHGPKVRETVATVKGRKYPRVVVDFGVVNGERKRRTFKTRNEADQAVSIWNAEQKILTRRMGDASKQFLTGDVQDAAAAMQILGAGVSLVDAATMYRQAREAGLTSGALFDAAAALKALPHAKDAAEALNTLDGRATMAEAARYFIERQHPAGERKTVCEAVEEYKRRGLEDGLRHDTLRDHRARLAKLVKSLGDRYVDEITPGEVRRWVDGLRRDTDGEQFSQMSKRNYRVTAHGFFAYCVEVEYCKENPLARRSTFRRNNQSRRGDATMPEALTPAEVEAIMHTAHALHPDLIPVLTLGFFAGIRTAELRRVDWRNVSLAPGRVTILPSVAKKHSVRHVDLADNAVAWLTPHKQTSGSVAPVAITWRRHLERVMKASGVKRWPSNCMRHTFATMHLQRDQDQNKTALQLGHRDTEVLFNHYRGLTTTEDAARFWSITPKTGSNVVQFKNA